MDLGTEFVSNNAPPGPRDEKEDMGDCGIAARSGNRRGRQAGLSLRYSSINDG